MARKIKWRTNWPASNLSTAPQDAPLESAPSPYTSRSLEWAKVAAIPLTGALVAAGVAIWSADLTSDRASDAVYVQLAIDTLSRELPEEGASEQKRDAEDALRRWAADVLSQSGPVRLPAAAADALVGGDILIPYIPSRYEDLRASCMADFEESSGSLNSMQREYAYNLCLERADAYIEYQFRQDEAATIVPTP